MATRAGLAKRRQRSARPLAAAKLRHGHAGAPLSKSDSLLVWPGAKALGKLRIPLPASVGWVPRGTLPRPRGPGLPSMPPGAAGAVAFRYEDAAGRTSAVSLEALGEQGERLDPRWRRTVGAKKGAVMRVGCVGGSPVVVVEGEVDALAASWMHGPEAECVAAGGTAGLAAWRPTADDDREIVLESDDDPAGAVAVIDAKEALRAMGCSVEVRWRGPGEGDVADELAKRVASEGWAVIVGVE